MRILLTLSAALALAGPASAQMNHGDMDHAGMEHGADHSHAEMDMPMHEHGNALMLADQPELGVAAVYVDLDAKTLNLVLRPGAEMSDETLRKAVKKSGYKVDSIARGAAVVGS